MDDFVFPKRLKGLRDHHGLTQKEMAQKFDISQAYYSKFEQGTGQPNLRLLAQICREFAISSDFLLGLSTINDSFDNPKILKDYVERYAKEHIKTVFKVINEKQEETEETQRSVINLLDEIKAAREAIRNDFDEVTTLHVKLKQIISEGEYKHSKFPKDVD